MSTSIHLTQDIEQRLDFLVAQTGRDKTYWLHEIIAQGLEDVEDYYLASYITLHLKYCNASTVDRSASILPLK